MSVKAMARNISGMLDQQLLVRKPETLYLTRGQINALLAHNFAQEGNPPTYKGVPIQEVQSGKRA